MHEAVRVAGIAQKSLAWRDEAGAAENSGINSVARLFLVPEGQNIYRIVSRLVAIQGYIAGIPEGNHQFAQLRARAANVGGRL